MKRDIVKRTSIDAMQDAMAEMPQIPGMATEHYFAGGMYCRRIEIKAGSLIVSKVHKTEHFFIGCSGELIVAGQGETYRLGPGDIVPSAPGTKRAVVAATDCVVLTVHRTDKTSTEGLEAELMAEDGPCLYDVNNQPKVGVLVADSPKRIE